MKNYFYGWYYRCQSKEESMAVIPAVHLSKERRSCSVQLITGKMSLYKEFPIEQFRINKEKGIMKIGKNIFSRDRIYLDFDVKPEEILCDNMKIPRLGKRRIIKGELRFGQWRKPKYDIMGPFSIFPKMECKHAVYSMRHAVSGSLLVNGKKMDFNKSVGYVEGDSGFSFPEKYVWVQHFLPHGSFMIAVASVPIMGIIRFTGVVGFFVYQNRSYRFASYLGAVIKKMDERELIVKQGNYTILVSFFDKKGECLKAPVGGKMTRNIRENVEGKVKITVLCGKEVLIDEITDRAAVEYENIR